MERPWEPRIGVQQSLADERGASERRNRVPAARITHDPVENKPAGQSGTGGPPAGRTSIRHGHRGQDRDLAGTDRAVLATFPVMEVLLLGTGSPSGWPHPGCGCASCACAAARGQSRSPASALVDDVLLLDPMPEVVRQVARSGRVLSRVATVLLSGQGDLSPVAAQVAALAAEGLVEVLGPEPALESYVGHPSLRPTAVSAGDVLHRDQYVLRAVVQGAGIGWDLSSSSGARLLYAPGAAVVQSAVTSGETGSYDAVLLGGGSTSVLGQSLAGLRRSGSVTDAADVVVVDVGHAYGHPDGLAEVLPSWGARTVPDGTCVPVGSDPTGTGRPASLRGRTLVLGGVRSGKSALAEQLLAAQPSVLYVATGGTRDDDADWRERVAAHVARRPASWRTIETSDIAKCLATAETPLLIDCLGTWLTSRLDHHGVWDGGALDPVEADVAELVRAWRSVTVPVVAVSNEVGSGVVPATASGRLFRDLLGRLNASVAAESETVVLTVAGVPLSLRVRTNT